MFVCHGNICRSTMAESVFSYLIQQEGLQGDFMIASSGTSREEIGNPVHYGTQEILQKHHIPVIPHQARQITIADIETYDYLLCMDDHNVKNLKRIAPYEFHDKIYKLLSFTGSDRDIYDPWYTGDFETTFDDVWQGCKALLTYLLSQ